MLRVNCPLPLNFILNMPAYCSIFSPISCSASTLSCRHQDTCKVFHSFCSHCSSLFLDGLRLLSIVPYTTRNYKAPIFYYNHYKEIQRRICMIPPTRMQNFQSFLEQCFYLRKKRKKIDEGEMEERRNEGRKGGREERKKRFMFFYYLCFLGMAQFISNMPSLFPPPAHQPTKKVKKGRYNHCELFTLKEVLILRLKLEKRSS